MKNLFSIFFTASCVLGGVTAQAQQQYGRKQKGNGSLHWNPSRIEIGAAPLDERRAALFRGFLRGGAEKDVRRRELFPTAGVYIE